jgi:pantothenate kinase type III
MCHYSTFLGSLKCALIDLGTALTIMLVSCIIVVGLIILGERKK